MLIEPHLGLPVFLSLLLLVPRAALPRCDGAVCSRSEPAVAGVSGMEEYIGRVLPAQAAAETNYLYQYSLTYLLACIGVPAALSLLAGELSYFAMSAIGIWLGAKLSGDADAPRAARLSAGRRSVIGGAYVHMVDLSVAIPAALVLAIALRGRARTSQSLRSRCWPSRGLPSGSGKSSSSPRFSSPPWS